MLTTVTLNPAIDETIIVDNYVLGGVHRIQTRRMDVGGKGINVSKVIGLFHGATIATGYLGEKNKRFFEDFLQQHQIQHNFVLIDDVTRTNTKIIDSSRKQTTEFNELGFYVDEKEVLELENRLKEYEKSSHYIIFSGSMPRGITTKTFTKYLSCIQDKKKIVLDASGDMLREGVKQAPFLIKPNIHELKESFGIHAASIDELIRKTLMIRERYQIQWILLSMGGDGCLLLSKNQVLQANAIPVEVKSTVGAGDSMLGGFIYAYDHFQDPIEALRYGVASGTMAVTMEGTEVFTQKEVMDLLPQVKIKDLSSTYLS
ncbi:MAG: 1-phosphofructokinase [Epulopiscium sp.]|nr:1-phosphofructokinase [Candidatus Epulonipiscium sp.]